MYMIIGCDKRFGATCVEVAHGRGASIGILSVCLFGPAYICTNAGSTKL